MSLPKDILIEEVGEAVVSYVDNEGVTDVIEDASSVDETVNEEAGGWADDARDEARARAELGS